MALIELRNVSKSYGPRCVLQNIHLAVEEGEFVSIVGTSASGKTTLLKLASGLLAPDHGQVLIEGQPVNGFPLRASIVFQNYSLLPWLSALENVRLAVESNFPDWSPTRWKDQALRYLDRVGLGAAAAKRPSQLSGGMRQRVAIARAFAVEPRILFLDEPFGALDAMTRSTLQQELDKLCQAQTPRATVLMITNSVDEGILLSDRILALGASLSAAVPVTLPRPRPADMMMHDENALRLRVRVTEFLTEGRKNGAAKATPKPMKVAIPVEA